MLYKKISRWLGVLFLSVFLLSFLFSYNFSSRGFFDFEQYLEDLRSMASNVRESLSGEPTEANGQEEDGQGGDEIDEGTGEEGEQEGTGSQNGFTDKVVYESLSEYKGKNPYGSFLTDREIVAYMRLLIGPDYYKHFMKSIPDAEEVYFDEASGLYTVKGTNEVIMDRLSGIIQLKDTGQMYIAYIMGGNIHYHTNDREFASEIIQNTHINQWIEENKNNKDIRYFNE